MKEVQSLIGCIGDLQAVENWSNNNNYKMRIVRDDKGGERAVCRLQVI